MIRYFLIIFILTPFYIIFSQNIIKGYIKDSLSGKALADVKVSINKLELNTKTDIIGYFSFKNIPEGIQTITFSYNGYQFLSKKIEVKEAKLDLQTIYLNKNSSDLEILPIIIENELLSGESTNQESVALLQSSKDIFQRISGFELNTYWFKPRGLSSDQYVFNINGISLRDVEDGQINYNNFTGLSNITRNPANNVYGFNAAPFSFGNSGGYTDVSTKPSLHKNEFNLSYTSANRVYNNRLSISYHSGLSKDGWAYSVSGSRTWAKEGIIDGTFYSGWSYFLALEKKINNFHSIYLTVFGTPIERGGASPNTLEVRRLGGVNYNSLWGWQNNKKRNERISTIFEPIFMLTHDWKINKNTLLKNTFSYQTGGSKISRLQGYSPEFSSNFTQSFSPVYFKNLPSFGLISENEWKLNTSINQINWQNLYAQNIVSGVAKYAIFNDVERNNNFSANSQFETKFSEKLNLSGAFNFQRSTTKFYKEVNDLLGANFVESKAQFNDYERFNLDNINTAFYKGDVVEYSYNFKHNFFNLFINSNYKIKKWEFDLGLNASNTNLFRVGNFRHFNYQTNNESKGKSQVVNFTNLGAKLSTLLKINPQNYLQVNVGNYSTAPTLSQVFPTARENNLVSPNLNSLKIFNSDVTYFLRKPKFNSKISLFYNYFKDDIEINRYFTQGVIGDELLTEILTGVNKKFYGTELSFDFKLTSSINIFSLASFSKYTFNNNPNLFTYDVNYSYRDLGKSYIKNNNIPGSAQQAYTLGIKYQSPKYWWLGLSGNFLGSNYSNFSYLLRTNSFVNSAPYIPTEEEVRGLLKQEEFESQILFNLNFGKSFKFGGYYLSFYGTINNLLNNRDYISGAFEQARLTDYVAFKDDKTSQNPLFGSRYWFDVGRTYFLTISLKL
ncbi:MAG: carboxypeptidase-like regulatory domain-containing protein [Solirubrobacteraceae bacterium]